jgi:hypothetical protein
MMKDVDRRPRARYGKIAAGMRDRIQNKTEDWRMSLALHMLVEKH